MATLTQAGKPASTRRPILVVACTVCLVLLPGTIRARGQEQPQLAPTVHPALPETATDLWLVPSDSDRAARTLATYTPLVTGVRQYENGDYAAALASVTRPSLSGTELANYATYYTGLAELRLARANDARRTFESLIGRKPAGYLAIAAAIGSAEAAEAAGDRPAALRIYQRLADDKTVVSDDILSRLGRAALAQGDRKAAAEAFLRIYYEFALTDAAAAAAQQLESLQDQIVRTGYKGDLGRAQMLFGARRYTEARAAFDALRPIAEGDDKELVNLRVAECDFNLKRYAAARDGVRPYLEEASRKAEARFFYLSALRELGDHDTYIAETQRLVTDFPDSSWSEEALNNLGTHYIVTNQDELAAQTFKQMYEKFPTGARSERGAWKYGWSRYTTGDYAETVRVFEAAAAAFPRSDYRPSYLYWAARAHGKLGEASQAEARLRLVYTDYGNSYYGRLAERQLSRRAEVPDRGIRHASQQQPATPGAADIPSGRIVRLLLANGLFDAALAELRYAQRAWGNSPPIDATIAWVYQQRGELRRAITLMRRAYPQHMTANGQELPAEILQVIFPLTYWDAIKKQSALHGLDPYMIAALIAQESTFDAGVRSSANAWGLMQIVPATGRRLARTLGIRRFTTATLTNADINIRLGTLYFSQLSDRFGGAYYALASYNAGENRVVRWKSERPGIDEDEFIDDIPFPETQNYVKRILGTAEDYRRLYGDGTVKPLPPPAASKAAPRASSAKPAAAKAKAKASSTTKKPTAKGKAPAKKAPAKKAPPKKPSTAAKTPRQ